MFDPTKPTNGSPNSSAEMRAQLNGLKALIDAIPAGPPGPEGPPGEVSQQDLVNERMNHAQNPTGVSALGLTISDPPTKAEVEAILGFINTLLSALQRQP